MKWAHLPSLLLGLALVSVPGLIYVERKAETTWTNRLAVPFIAEERARHTPRESVGTFLPPRVTVSRTVTAADSPVIVAGPTRVEPGATLTITAGTQLFFQEFAGLVVDGTLVTAGSVQQPVVLQTNEMHPANQVWSGITFTAAGTGQLAYTQIDDASPGIACLPGSQLVAHHLTIRRGSLGLFLQSPQCVVRESTINGPRDGVVVTGEGRVPSHSLRISARRRAIWRPAPAND